MLLNRDLFSTPTVSLVWGEWGRSKSGKPDLGIAWLEGGEAVRKVKHSSVRIENLLLDLWGYGVFQSREDFSDGLGREERYRQ